jgi:alanyl-tRNA synthetase
VVDIAGISFLAAQVDGDNKAMMQTLDTVRSQLPVDALVVLASVDNGKVAMVAATSKSLSARLSAAQLMQTVAPLVGAKGGGRPDLARAGGGDQVDAVAQALTAAQEWVEGQLAS